MLVRGEEVVDVLLWHVPQVLECPVGEAEVRPVLRQGRVRDVGRHHRHRHRRLVPPKDVQQTHADFCVEDLGLAELAGFITVSYNFIKRIP